MSASRETYRLRLLQCYQLARLAAAIPTGEMIESIDHADSVGAILDPTLYRDRHGAMMEDKRVIEAVHGLAELGRALVARAQAAGVSPIAAIPGAAARALERLEREG